MELLSLLPQITETTESTRQRVFTSFSNQEREEGLSVHVYMARARDGGRALVGQCLSLGLECRCINTY